ncbi:MAG: hypothetical protein AAGD06_13245 [Acidobacteriota bacterium]
MTLRPSKLLPVSILAVAVLWLASVAPAGACGGKPVAPFCGKTLVLAKAGPSNLLLPGGGTFDVPTTVYLSIVESPPGSGLCPVGPYAVDIDLTVTCSPAGDGAGSVTGVTITNGYNQIDVPVTVPAGPARECAITGEARAVLADATELSNRGDSVVCFVDPAPGDPSVPRLDLQHLLPGGEIAGIHPGDQASHRFVLTNNDPTETYTGNLGAEMRNASRLPTLVGPPIPGSDTFSISDPGPGDNFPIAFGDDLGGSCLALPPDPLAPTVPTLSRPIVLLPGQSEEFEIVSRPWGMCADGSCGEGTVVVEGAFSDGSDAFSCTGFVTAAEIAQPPSFGWPDAGEVAVFLPPPNPQLGRLEFEALPLPGDPLLAFAQPAQMQLALEGQPPILPEQLLAEPMTEERGRISTQFADPQGLFPLGDPFDFFLQMQLGSVIPELQMQLLQMDFHPGAPTGFADTGPLAMGLLGFQPQVEPPGFPFDAMMDLTYQASAMAVDDLGQLHSVVFQVAETQPLPDGSGFDLHLRGQVVPAPGSNGAEGPPPEIVELTFLHDLRAFASRGALVFRDGFERGDFGAWSTVFP